MLKKLTIFLFIISIFYYYVQSINERVNLDKSDFIKKDFEFNGEKRNIWFSRGVDNLLNRNSSLIIYLHGKDGAWPNDFTKKQYEIFNKFAYKNNFIIAFPQGSLGSCYNKQELRSEFYYCWSEKDIEFINKLRDTILNTYKTNPNKVFLVGFSNGGYFISKYIENTIENKFNGYGIHSAGGHISDKKLKKIDNLPFFLSIGLNDNFQIEEMKNIYKILKKNIRKDELEYIEFNGSHNINDDLINREIEFFSKDN